MNYQKIYTDLILRSKLENRRKVKGSTYYERHHIIPRCLGGLDTKENLILFTAREHFLAHRLLLEIYPSNGKLIHATWMLANKLSSGNQIREYKVSSREYERLKLLRSKEMSINMKGKLVGELNPMFGHTGKLNNFWGKNHSPEFNKWRGETSKNRELIECPYCKVIMNSANVVQYHFDNCLLRPGATDEEKLKRKNRMNKATEASLEKIECPYCLTFNRMVNSYKYHFENCILAPELSDVTKKRIFDKEETARRRKEENEEMIRNRPDKHYKCPHCGYETSEWFNFFKYHLDNCKLNPDRNVTIYTCPYCPIETENKTNVIRFHGDNCKLKPT